MSKSASRRLRVSIPSIAGQRIRRATSSDGWMYISGSFNPLNSGATHSTPATAPPPGYPPAVPFQSPQ